MSVSRTVYEIFSVKEWRDLENRVRVVQGHWRWRCAIDHVYNFVSVGHFKYSPILYHFWDRAIYLSKIVIFFIPLAFNAPFRGPRRNFAILFGMEKLEWRGYLMMKKCDDTFSRFGRIPMCDGQTDGRTDGWIDILRQHSPRCAYNRAVKIPRRVLF